MSTTSKKPPILVDFGACVRQCRVAQGYSQEAFADICEIDRSYMGGIERGERNLALINIIRIIQALEMEPSEFFRGLDGDGRQELKMKRETEKKPHPSQVKFKKTTKPKKSVHAL